MGLNIKGIMGESTLIASLEQEVVQLQISDTSNNNSQQAPQTILDKILERFNGNGADTKFLKRTKAKTTISPKKDKNRQTTEEEDDDELNVIAKNIFRLKLDEKRRIIFSYFYINNEAYIYILEDMKDHNYKKFNKKYENFDFEHYIKADTVKKFIKEQLKKKESVSTANVKEKEYSIDYFCSQFYNGEFLALTQNQDEAVKTPTPCVCLGGAGTGKTVLATTALEIESKICKHAYHETPKKIKLTSNNTSKKGYKKSFAKKKKLHPVGRIPIL